jgi:hypothetical protein
MPNVYKNGVGTIPQGAVLVDRKTKWGNHYRIGVHGSREQVIAKFEAWLRASPVRMRIVREELRGKDLVCHCAPLPCHADVLLRIANEDLPD